MRRRSFVALMLAGACCVPFVGFSAEELPEMKTPILAIGDSMMKLLGLQLEKSFKSAGISPMRSFASLASGLVRTDVFNWYAKAAELMEQDKPKTVIALIGTNDRQTLRSASGNEIPFGTPEWKAEYSQRIGHMMDTILQGGAEHLIWMLQPDMKEHAQQEYAILLNKILQEQSVTGDRKGKVFLFDMRPLLTKTPGKFTLFVMSPTGAPLTVRERDGIHLTNVGAKRVADSVVKTYWSKK